MPNRLGGITKLPSSPHLPVSPAPAISIHSAFFPSSSIVARKQAGSRRALCFPRRAIRRARYDEGEEEEGEDEEYGHNAEVAMLEAYSQEAKGEALLVTATVEGQEVEVLVFKGFSSCLSYGTSPDPTRSILPARAVISSIDRIKGPCDPSNIEYIEKGLSWEAFKTRFSSPIEM